MYIYLSKKVNLNDSSRREFLLEKAKNVFFSKFQISVPDNSAISSCSWNRKEGYVAAGTEKGLVKVIKLEMLEGKDKNKTEAKSQNGLVMNESLESHSSEIASITWNEPFNKLTTADSNGKIVVWVFYEGQWCEEMVNKRDKTIVTGMKWSSDGQNICIVYNDGIFPC
jgi:WD repeat-containing protein 35